jgi:hypothetical protein
MPEHQIRLRRGWRWLKDVSPPGAIAAESGHEIALPATWPERAGAEARVRLVRLFTAPSIDPLRETLLLRLSAVAGLVSVQLNGQELARPAPGTTDVELPLRDPLPRRNRLVLDILPPGAGPFGGGAPEAWGSIALVIRDAAASAADGSGAHESLGGSDLPA